MKMKHSKERLAARIKSFEESGRPGGKSGRVAANGFAMHKPGSLKK